MPEGDAGQAAEPASRRRRTGRWLRRITACLVVLALAAAGAAYRFDLGTRLGLHRPDPVTEPAQVLPPAGLALPTARAAAAVAGTTPDPPVDGSRPARTGLPRLMAARSRPVGMKRSEGWVMSVPLKCRSSQRVTPRV